MDYSKYVNHFDYKADRQAWGREEGRITALFEDDLAEAFGVTVHPKRLKLFAKAWDMGHSSGLHEVEHYYSELVELIV